VACRRHLHRRDLTLRHFRRPCRPNHAESFLSASYPGVNVIESFFLLLAPRAYTHKFFPCKPFQCSSIFAGKAVACLQILGQAGKLARDQPGNSN